MAKSYVHELGDRLSHGSTAANLPKHIVEIAPVMYNDGNNNYASIQSALNGKSSTTHTHGNITNGGALQTNDVAIANGDKLVVTDASDSNKVARTSVSFDGSTTTTALTPKGTFETFSKLTIGTTSTTAAAGNHTHSSITTVGDKRNVAPAFADYSNKIVFQGLKTNSVINSPSSDTYSYLIGLRGWSDASVGKTHELAFNDTGIFHRTGSASSNSSWAQVLTDKYTGNNSNFRTIPQDMSKGANIVVNGQGQMGNNYNWSRFRYDGSDCYNGSSGSFYVAQTGTSSFIRASDEYIAVDCNKKTIYSADIKYTGLTTSRSVALIPVMYDIDKKEILANYVMYGAGTLTTLAQALNPGDTVIYLTSVANWSNDIGYTYKRGFIFWNYTNSLGYTYPPETYSRNCYENWFDSASSINTTNNTITLNKAWTGPAIAAGTKVSKSDSGGTYVYINWTDVSTANDGKWISLKGSMKGFATTGNNPARYRQGTAFIKTAFITYGGTNVVFRFTNYKAYEVPDEADQLSTAKKLAVNLANTSTDSTFNGSADQTGIKVSGTLGVGNGGTGKTTANGASNAILGNMNAASRAPEDSSLFTFKYVTPTDDNGALYSRTGSQVWSYFKDKMFSDTGVNISGNAATATTATKLGSSTLGSGTKPIYLSSGTATECSTYAGGTAVTLNGTSKSASTASFYAPTGAGTSGQLLKSSGSGAPTWATANAALVGITVTSSSVSDGTNTFNKYTHPTTSGNKHVPSGGSSGQFLGWDSDGTAKWVANPNTDTKNTAGSTDTSSKIFLIGATSQAANPQTYSQDTTYVDTDATLASTKVRVAEKCTLQFNTTTNALDFVFA